MNTYSKHKGKENVSMSVFFYYFQRTFTMHLLWKMNNYLQMNHSVDNIVFNALRISEKLSTARKQI